MVLQCSLSEALSLFNNLACVNSTIDEVFNILFWMRFVINIIESKLGSSYYCSFLK